MTDLELDAWIKANPVNYETQAGMFEHERRMRLKLADEVEAMAAQRHAAIMRDSSKSITLGQKTVCWSKIGGVAAVVAALCGLVDECEKHLGDQGKKDAPASEVPTAIQSHSTTTSVPGLSMPTPASQLTPPPTPKAVSTTNAINLPQMPPPASTNF